MPCTATTIWVGSASVSVPSKKVIMAGTRSNRGFAFCKHEARFVWVALRALALLLLSSVRGWCGDPAWRVLIEPKFMRHEVAFEIPKSRRAELIPALVQDG